MATDTQKSPNDSEELDQFIEKQIQVTRAHVKMVSVATGFTTLAAGVLGFLLLLSLFDHWVWGLSVWMRLCALVGLLVGSAVFFVWRILPGMLRSVNPVYAAQTIEQSSPSLKNSLINFLLLRRPDRGIRPVIYDGVRRQAAQGLNEVHVDSAVDRSELIRVGYVLATLVILFGIYRILSPKDPFQTVARVAAPWKSIARPSRATIDQVDPGNVEIYRGQSLTVSAVIDGLREGEQVELIYSTKNGQMVDQTIAMRTDEAAHRYRCELTTGSKGIQHDLNYQIRAGDAESEPYRVVLKEAPSILVQQITYQFPSYTQRPEEVIERQGDLVALEGTRVKVQALANQPIRTAYLELFENSDDERPVKSVPMSHEGELAEGQMTLTLRADRKTSSFAAYQLRFTNQDDARNEEPARYQIEVTADLPPLVEILNPLRREIEVAENRKLMIEIRALDPDFALNAVRLHAAAAGQELLKQGLLDSPHEGQGVFIYELQPNRLGLTAGDTLVYWAEAEDNRREAGTRAAAPNLTRTENYRIRVVAPEEVTDGTEENPASESSDSQENDPQDSAEGDEGGGEGEQGNQGTEGGQGDDQAAESAEGAEGSQTADGEAGDGESDLGTGGDGSAKTDSKTDSKTEQQEAADQETGDDESQAGEGNQSGESELGQESPEQDGGGANNSGQRGTGEPQASEGEQGGDSELDQEPVASDGSNDADAIDRILEHSRRQNQSPSDGESNSDPNRQPEEAQGSADQDSAESSERADGESQESLTEDAANSEAGAAADADPQSQTDSKQTTDEAAGGDSVKTPESNEASEGDELGDQADGAGKRSGHEDDLGDRDSQETTDQNSSQQNASDQNTPDGQNDRPSTEEGSESSDEQQSTNSTDEESANESRSESTERIDDQTEKRNPAQEETNSASDSASSSDTSSSDTSEENRRPNEKAGSAESDVAEADTTDGSEPQDGASSQQDTGTNDGSNPQDAEDSQDNPQPRTGGRPGDGTGATDGAVEGEPGEDEANLDYSRQATDLALEHLRDQQDNRDLLDELGWTPEDARRFLDRWQQMKRDAGQQGARGQRAQQTLDDQLRGLGLSPQAAQARSIRRSQGTPPLRDDGARSAPPSQYRDHYRAFLRGINRDRGSDSGR